MTKRLYKFTLIIHSTPFIFTLIIPRIVITRSAFTNELTRTFLILSVKSLNKTKKRVHTIHFASVLKTTELNVVS